MEWKNKQKEGPRIYFYKNGNFIGGEWKNSKRDGKGLMIYVIENIYQGKFERRLKVWTWYFRKSFRKSKWKKYYGY